VCGIRIRLALANMAIGRGESLVLKPASRTGRGLTRRKRDATQRLIASD
jgi:hypothetical protein